MVVEDDRTLASLMLRALREDACRVGLAQYGQEAEWLSFENPYDCIILDLMLPIKDGLTVLKNIRVAGNSTPVLILTAKEGTDFVIKGLDEVADDYLKKPFSLEELLARVRAFLRRRDTGVSTIIEVGPIIIDPATKQISRDGLVLDLTAKEYALMEYFSRNPRVGLSRAQLSEPVWDMNFEPSSNVVDVYVGYFRNKVDKPWESCFIRTMRGHGYMLDIRGYQT